MNKRSNLPVLLALTALLASFGCSGSGESTESATPEAATPPAGARSADTLPIPSAGGGELPTGHPPIEGGATGITAGQPGGIAWQVPDGWEATPLASDMRIAQYRVPGSLGDGECVVYYFGPGQGGDPMANARRWAGQFIQPDGSSSVERMKVETVSGARLAAQLVEVTGTYDGGMTMTAAPAEAKVGHMLLGGIVEGPDAPWFFKFTGPESTVRKNRDAFVDLLRSVKVED